MSENLESQHFRLPLHPQNHPAQMAESVDALVSNTSGFTSIPVRPRVWVLKQERFFNLSCFFSNAEVIYHHNAHKQKVAIQLLFHYLSYK